MEEAAVQGERKGHGTSGPPMKVCLLAGEFPPLIGGVADYTAHLARSLHERGLAVAVITSAAARPLREVYPFVVHPVMPHWGIGAWPRLDAVLRAERPDIVHIQYQTAAFGMSRSLHFLPWWLRRRGYQAVTTFHDLLPPYLFPKAGRVRAWVVAHLARSSDAVVAITEEDFIGLQQMLDGRSALLRAIPIGSNILPPAEEMTDDERRARRAALGVGPEDFLLAYFGLLNRSKGLETLLEALARLRSEAPARLVVIGGDPGASDRTNIATRRWFLRELEARRLIEAVSVTGHVAAQEVSKYLQAADVCVLPYRDGASLRRGSLMAALVHGCAIVTTTPMAQAPATPLLPRLEDGRQALLVPPGDAAALARALQRLWAQPALRRGLQEEARSFAHAFAWEGIAAATEGLYRELRGVVSQDTTQPVRA